MPGMQLAPLAMPQVDPMGPPAGAQFDPLQQRLGLGGVCGVHVNPGAHPPVESQRQPWVPTMHVELTPSVPELAPPLELEELSPELPLEDPPPSLPRRLGPPSLLPFPPLLPQP